MVPGGGAPGGLVLFLLGLLLSLRSRRK
jgi:MYXO-CTERM domain-containing protein